MPADRSRQHDKERRPAREARGGESRPRGERGRADHKPEEGYTRLFINLGKRDNFYAREIINLVNRYVKGQVDIGRIDLTTNCSFFEVPSEYAETVMHKMARAKVGERRVVVDWADREPRDATRRPRRPRSDADEAGSKGKKGKTYKKDDWKQFFEH